MRRWPRLRLRPGRAAAPAPRVEPDESARSESPADQWSRYWTELALLSARLGQPWASASQHARFDVDVVPGAAPVRVVATSAIYHSLWYATEFCQPPYRYLQRGDDASWLVRHVDGDDVSGYRPGAMERRFDAGQEEFVLEHIRGLRPGRMLRDREVEDERRRRYWRAREY